MHINYQVAGYEIAFVGNRFDANAEFERPFWEELFAVGIHKNNLEIVISDIRVVKQEPQGQGAMRVLSWKGGRPDGIKCSEDTEFAKVVGC